MTLSSIAAAGFTYVSEYICHPEYDHLWTNKGDRVRGRFQLVRMGRSYSEQDAHTEAAKVPGRHVATVYELAHYVSNGWNGSDFVVAFGSSCAHPDGERGVATLWRFGANREFSLLRANILWREYELVLCVCE